MSEDLKKAFELIERYEILVEKQKITIEFLRTQLVNLNSIIASLLTDNQ